jgi:hypothetical protein
VHELFSNSVASGPSTRINSALPGGLVLDFKITPDSRQVVYIAPQETIGVNELYRNLIPPRPSPPSLLQLLLLD